MLDSLHNIISTAPFMPHGYCFNWLPPLVILHVFSDLMIGISYMMIPICLAYFIYKREDLPFGWIFICFTAFIFSCGTTHFMEVWTLWHADYWASGFIKLATAMVSFFTALFLIYLIPFALRLPSFEILIKGNNELKSMLQKLQRKENEIKKTNVELLLANESLNLSREELSLKNIKLEEASRLKSEFLANMSHELRTPLNSIIGFSELIFTEQVGSVSDKQKELLSDVLSSSRHLLHLIDDVLDLSKVEAGKIEFIPEMIDLNKMVKEVSKTLSKMIANKGIHYSTQVDPSLVDIWLDRSKLKQVLYNYISNSLKFTDNNGQIDINIYPEKEGYFRLEVKDTGIGIREEDYKKIFIEFQQLDSGFGKKYPGTGLGLSLTKRIVEAQGGTVGFESVFGEGSIFYVILPCQFKHAR